MIAACPLVRLFCLPDKIITQDKRTITAAVPPDGKKGVAASQLQASDIIKKRLQKPKPIPTQCISRNYYKEMYRIQKMGCS